jgi:hypothetical protein
VFTTNMLQSLFKAMIGAIGEDPASSSLHGLRRVVLRPLSTLE